MGGGEDFFTEETSARERSQARYSARAKVTVAGLTDGADAVSFSGRPEPPVRLTITSARP